MKRIELDVKVGDKVWANLGRKYCGTVVEGKVESIDEYPTGRGMVIGVTVRPTEIVEERRPKWMMELADIRDFGLIVEKRQISRIVG